MNETTKEVFARASMDLEAAKALGKDFPVQAYGLVLSAFVGFARAACLADGWYWSRHQTAETLLHVLLPGLYVASSSRIIKELVEDARNIVETGRCAQPAADAIRDVTRMVSDFAADVKAYMSAANRTNSPSGQLAF